MSDRLIIVATLQNLCIAKLLDCSCNNFAFLITPAGHQDDLLLDRSWRFVLVHHGSQVVNIEAAHGLHGHGVKIVLVLDLLLTSFLS